MDFEAYLLSKKIDSAAFLGAESKLWNAWKYEFDQVHPKSFTAQKLYLINPIRRKYPLTQQAEVKKGSNDEPVPESVPEKVAGPVVVRQKPAIPKPVFRPKPKTD